MSLATKTYVIANGNPNDGSQVEQDFNDLIGFINGSLPHSDGSGGAADIRGLVFANAAQNSKKYVYGGPTNVNVVSGQNESFTTIPFGVTLGAGASVRITFGTIHPANPVSIRVSAVTTTGFTVGVEKSDGTAFGASATYNIFWDATG